MNKVCLIGRLVSDATVRDINSEKKVADFTLAVNRNLSSEAKQKAKQTADFIKCKAWDSRADFIKNYTSKGKKIGVTGQIQSSCFNNSEGAKIYTTYVLVDNVDLLESKKIDQYSSEESTESTNISGFDLPF